MSIYMLEPIQQKLLNRSKPGEANEVLIEYSHLCADSEEELMTYAQSIGLLATSVQEVETGKPRFDVTGKALQAAINDPNVQKLTSYEFAQRRFPEFQPK